jgi:hypothetical protein
MTRKTNAVAALTSLLLAWGGAVQATEVVSVGRVDLQLPGEGWQSFAVPDQGNDISGTGVTHRQQTETRILLRHAPDQTIDAIFIVRANVSGKGRFSGVAYSDVRCEGPSGALAEGDPPGPAAKSFRCLVVTPPGAVGAQNPFFKQMLDLLKEKEWKVAPRMHLILAKQYANTGAFADITALVAPEALPTLSDNTELLPAGVSAASVQWGRLLQTAVTDSVYSIRGKLPVPKLSLAGAPAPSN